jgi:hypothetical protein
MCNQIHHILIERRQWTNVYVRSMRGAETESDHF